MYKLKGGPVSQPRWMLGLRLLQLVLAIIVLALTAYALSRNGGRPLRSPLIATIIIALLTIFPIFFVTTAHHFLRRIYDPRIALALDGFATLFWLAAFTALACYVRIFGRYSVRRGVRRAAIASTVFGAFEFALFLLTTTLFLYYYHCHLSGISVVKDKTPHTDPENTTHRAETSNTAAHGGDEQHQMQTLPAQTDTNTNRYSGVPSATGAGTGNTAGVEHTQRYDLPYPERPPRETPQGGYGAYAPRTSGGYSAENRI